MKSTIESITGISNGWLEDFVLLGNVDNNTIKSTIDKQKRRLSNIYDQHLSKVNYKPPKLQVDELLRKLRHTFDNKTNTDWTTRELQTLAYNLSALNGKEDAAYLHHALQVIDENWNDRLIRGLISTLIRMWNALLTSNRDAICKLLTQKLSEYDGNRVLFVRLKENIDLLCEAGPMRLAALMKHKQVAIEDAPRQMGLSCNTIDQSFFSDTILTYYKGLELKKIDEIMQFMVDREHIIMRTKQLLASKIIYDANEKCNELQQDQISKRVQTLLGGDISQSTTWNPFKGATEDEKTKLQKAQEIIKQWAVRKVLNVFFKVCVQDPERKSFWLDYVSVISSFKIVGSSQVRANLNNDPRTTRLMRQSFYETDQRTNNTAALVLYIQNKIFVEFSDVGALYVYDKNNPHIKNVIRYRINKTDDLKMPSIGKLIDQDYYYDTYYDEGKMNHRGDWTSRLSLWMRKKLDIDINDTY